MELSENNRMNVAVPSISPMYSIDSKPGKETSPNNSSNSSNSIFCRICHEGESMERLLAPCKCTGTVALIHKTCLEQWLTSSNSDQCEICKFAYKTSRQPRPCSEYLQDRANQFNVRNLIADIICFFLLTPLLIVSTYLCALGANQYFFRERWEAIGLVVLSIFLIAVYFTWCHVTTRFHIGVWKLWQRSNQQVRLLDVDRNSNLTTSPSAHYDGISDSELPISGVGGPESRNLLQHTLPITYSMANPHYQCVFVRPPTDLSSAEDINISDTRQMIP